MTVCESIAVKAGPMQHMELLFAMTDGRTNSADGQMHESDHRTSI